MSVVELQLLADIEYNCLVAEEIQAWSALSGHIGNERRVTKGLGPMRRFLTRCIHIQRAIKKRYTLASERLNHNEYISRRDITRREDVVALQFEEIALRLDEESGRMILTKKWLWDAMLVWRGWVRLLASSQLHRSFYGVWNLELDMTRRRYVAPNPHPPPLELLSSLQSKPKRNLSFTGAAARDDSGNSTISPQGEVAVNAPQDKVPAAVQSPKRPKYDSYVYAGGEGGRRIRAAKNNSSAIVHHPPPPIEALLFDRLEITEFNLRANMVHSRDAFVFALHSKADSLHLPDAERTARSRLQQLEDSRYSTVVRQSLFTLAYHSRRDLEEIESSIRKMDLERQGLMGLMKIVKLGLGERSGIQQHADCAVMIAAAIRSASAKREVETKRCSRSQSPLRGNMDVYVGKVIFNEVLASSSVSFKQDLTVTLQAIARSTNAQRKVQKKRLGLKKSAGIVEEVRSLQNTARSTSAQREVEAKRVGRSNTTPQ